MSALFSAYRTVGLTCGGAQQHVQALGDETFLTTPIGKSFLVWRADHLSVAMASSPLPHTITCARARRTRARCAALRRLVPNRPRARHHTTPPPPATPSACAT